MGFVPTPSRNGDGRQTMPLPHVPSSTSRSCRLRRTNYGGPPVKCSRLNVYKRRCDRRPEIEVQLQVVGDTVVGDGEDD
ncbi:hypothetical protein HanPI659440_Chr16g0627801 [Helianthus annuus]|nr:hypothetical protein HanPI659440_Chr16g0627801 [Helianthus annuus]